MEGDNAKLIEEKNNRVAKERKQDSGKKISFFLIILFS